MCVNLADPGSAEAVTPEDFEKLLVDRRKFHRPFYRVTPTSPMVFYTPRLREKLTGIVIHQTACDMGESVGRYDTIGSHFAILRNAKILWMADPRLEIIHANGFNARCLGIEYNGRYPGLLDDPNTAHDEALATTWNDPTTKHREQPMTAPPEMLLAGRMLLRWLKHRYPELLYLLFHRQSSGTRQNDPGQEIAVDTRRVAIELGLSDGGPGFKIDSGRAIPYAWGGQPGVLY